MFLNSIFLLLPLILFYYDFGIYRNNYRALKIFYWIPANLLYNKKRKIANNFILSLGPYRAAIKNIILVFLKPVKELDRGTFLYINGIYTKIYIFTILLTGDILQQADNNSFLRYNIIISCKICLISSA